MTDNEVISVIARTIKDRYPEARIEKEQVAQGAREAFFFVYVIHSEVDRVIARRYRQVFSVAVKFYSKPRQCRECFAVASVLWEAFRKMTYQGKTIKGRKLEYKVDDGVLNLYLEVQNDLLETQIQRKFSELEVLTDGE